MKYFFSLFLLMLSTFTLSAQEVNFVIDDVFSITGRGIFLAGQLKTGTISTGDRLECITAGGKRKNTYSVSGLEQFRRAFSTISEPGHYAVIISGAEVQDFSRGDRLVAVAQASENFFLPVADKLTVRGKGTLAIGTIVSGGIQVGDAVEIIGNGYDRLRTIVTYIERDRTSVNAATTGDEVALVLRGIPPDQLPYGVQLVKPGTGRVGNYLEIDVVTSGEIKLSGSNEIEVRSHYTPAAGVPAHVLLGVGLLSANPGQRLLLRLFLTKANYYRTGDRISLLINGLTVASGTVSGTGE